MKTKWFLSAKSAQKYATSVMHKFMDEFCAKTNGTTVFDTDIRYVITKNDNEYDVAVVSDSIPIFIGKISADFRWNAPCMMILGNTLVGCDFIDYSTITKVDTDIDAEYLVSAKSRLDAYAMAGIIDSLAKECGIFGLTIKNSDSDVALRINCSISPEKVDSRYINVMKIKMPFTLKRVLPYAYLDVSKISATIIAMNSEISRKETELYDGYQQIVDSVGGAMIVLDGNTRILCHKDVRPSLGTHIVFKCPYTGNLEAIKAEYETISFAGIDTLTGRTLLG